MGCSKQRHNIEGSPVIVTENVYEYRRCIAEHIDSNDVVLEVGCAEGLTTALLAQQALRVSADASYISAHHSSLISTHISAFSITSLPSSPAWQVQHLLAKQAVRDTSMHPHQQMQLNRQPLLCITGVWHRQKQQPSIQGHSPPPAATQLVLPQHRGLGPKQRAEAYSSSRSAVYCGVH
jgi:hypothetical protein